MGATKWQKEHPERVKEVHRQWVEKNRERVLQKQREWRKNNRTHLLELKLKYREKQRTELNIKQKTYVQRIRFKVLVHYGGDPPKCACCGESHVEFLEIDHIKGGGTEHRKKVRKYGSEFYNWLVKNNYPEGYRVLCSNCNSSNGRYGYCPHQK